jgi:hypothetical protein
VAVGTVVRLDRTEGAHPLGGVDPALVYPAEAAGSVLAHLPGATSLAAGPGSTADDLADRVVAVVAAPPPGLRAAR